MKKNRNARRRKTKEIVVFSLEMIAVILIIINRLPYIFTNYNDCTAETTGYIIKTVEKDINGSRRYYPIIQIYVDGKSYEHERVYGTNKKEWNEGDTIEIRFNPENPNKLFTKDEIDSHKTRAIGMAAGILAMAGLVLGSGYFTIWRRR